MVGKNNQWLLKKKMGQRYTRWSLRRLSIGVVSVAVSSGVFLFSNMMLDPIAHAATTDMPTTTAIATPASASATTTPTATTTDSSASTTSQASATSTTASASSVTAQTGSASSSSATSAAPVAVK